MAGSFEIAEAGAAALLWGAIFLWGGEARAQYAVVLDRSGFTSLGAGMSIAYVFVHMMPELHNIRVAFAAAVPLPLRYEGMATYFLALLGFLAYHGLDRLHASHGETTSDSAAAHDFNLQVGGFATYVLLMSYLLVDNLHETHVSIALFALAMAFHFLAVDHALLDHHGAAYRRVGRRVLAGTPIVGWLIGVAFAVPQSGITMLVAFLSGAIIMNSTIMELKSNQNGKLLPMIIGGVVYGLILLPFGQ